METHADVAVYHIHDLRDFRGSMPADMPATRACDLGVRNWVRVLIRPEPAKAGSSGQKDSLPCKRQHPSGASGCKRREATDALCRHGGRRASADARKGGFPMAPLVEVTQRGHAERVDLQVADRPDAHRHTEAANGRKV